MCELFAFSGAHEGLLHCALHEFARHGAPGRNPDGWGMASYLDGDIRLVKDGEMAVDSACLHFIERHPIRSSLVLSHVRHATQGARTVRNSQPFARELGGHMHVFAHNGDLDRTGLETLLAAEAGRDVRPLGETDSEAAFCLLLQRLRPLWLACAPGQVPPLPARLAVLQALAARWRALGPANFIYADGDALFVHGHRRRAPGAPRAEPPGLHLRTLAPGSAARGAGGVADTACGAARQVYAVPGLHLQHAAEAGPITLVASVPLDDHPDWHPLAEGALVVIRHGVVLADGAGPPASMA